MLCVLASAGADTVASSPPDTRLFVVMLRNAAGAVADLAVAFERRIGSSALTVERWFADGLPEADAAAPSPGVASGPIRGRRGRLDPFDFDPLRVALIRARGADSARAESLLRADPAVEWVERNLVREIAARWDDDSGVLPDEPLLRDTRQWGLFNPGPAGVYGGTLRADVHAPEAWMRSVGGPAVRLAIADSGIDPEHPELNAPLAAGGMRVRDGFDATGSGQPIADFLGHGTMAAGVMAARTGEGVHFDSLGIAGMCGGDGGTNPGCVLVPIRITRGAARTATSFDISRAIVGATALGARALNLSFAGGGRSRLERLALHHAIARGCVVVAASGNRGHIAGGEPMYPAAYAADGLCIAVGASDRFDRRTLFSSYGRGVDVVAPGVDIWSTWPTYHVGHVDYPGYVAGSGTSFAAPFVTGTLGLLAAARPELADRDAQMVLRATAHDVGAPGVDAETGAGRLDAGLALHAVRGEIGIWHDEAVPEGLRALGTDTLRIAEAGPANFAATAGAVATMFEVTATVAVPDSFVDSVHVWPRVGGTFTVRPGHALAYFAPWAEVAGESSATGDQRGPVRVAGRRFTLRGYAYLLETSEGERWIPLPPDQLRIGFTVIGRVRREPAGETPRPRSLSALPNPFRTTTRIDLAGPGDLRIADISGRLVLRAALGPGARSFQWDGRDGHGRRVPPGVYLLRFEGAGAGSSGRIVRLE
jgi:subtilisin family serine protease